MNAEPPFPDKVSVYAWGRNMFATLYVGLFTTSLLVRHSLFYKFWSIELSKMRQNALIVIKIVCVVGIIGARQLDIIQALDRSYKEAG